MVHGCRLTRQPGRGLLRAPSRRAGGRQADAARGIAEPVRRLRRIVAGGVRDMERTKRLLQDVLVCILKHPRGCSLDRPVRGPDRRTIRRDHLWRSDSPALLRGGLMTILETSIEWREHPGALPAMRPQDRSQDPLPAQSVVRESQALSLLSMRGAGRNPGRCGSATRTRCRSRTRHVARKLAA